MGKAQLRPAAVTCQWSWVLGADQCPAKWPQPSHSKAPGTHSAFRKEEAASSADGTSGWGFPGSETRIACQAAKRHFLVPSAATAPAHHPSLCTSQRCPGTHAKTPADLLSSLLLRSWAVTSREPHPPPASRPDPGLTLRGSAACPRFPSWWGPTTSSWRMAD